MSGVLTVSTRESSGVQHMNHATDATFNAFKHILVLTDGMALKVVMLGSLALAFLA